MSELRLQKKFLKPDSVDESKIKLSNDGALRARNAADSADIELLKLDASNKLQLLVMPEVSADASSANQLVRKSQLDAEIAGAAGDITALEGRVTAIENDYGVAGGLATLDGAGLVPASQLPSYVDDVLEFANLAAFPATGETGKIYVAIDTSKCYRWSGSTYVYITSGAVDSVNGQTGIVVLTASDIQTAASVSIESKLGSLDSEDLTFLKLDGSRPMGGDLNMDGSAITGAFSYSAVDGTLEALLDSAGLNLSDSAGTAQVILTKESLDSAEAFTVITQTGALSLQSGDSFVELVSLDPVKVSAPSLDMQSVKIINLAAGVASSDAATKGQVDAAQSAANSYTDGQVDILEAEDLTFLKLDGSRPMTGALNMSAFKITGLQDGMDPNDAVTVQQLDAEETRALAAEAALDSRATALEVASLQFMAPELFVLTNTDITNGYIDLSSLAVQYSINAFVDRLAIHEGNDYTVSVVGGKTRMTFAGPLITPGQEKLSAGDEIRVKYAKRAI